MWRSGDRRHRPRPTSGAAARSFITPTDPCAIGAIGTAPGDPNMKFSLPVPATLAAVLLVGLGRTAVAEEPGSLLVFPYFDNTRGELTVITVTNTNDDSNDPNATVNVEFIYRNQANCLEFNRLRTLTPNDEITVVTKYDNPNMVRGYVYVFATSHTTGQAIKFDHLVGHEIILNNVNTTPDFASAPFVYKAGAALANGAPTDVNANGLRDLDGIEYAPAPDKLVFPRFIGQGEPFGWDSQLVLLNLTGGAQFQALVDLLIYNDNEEVFSAQFQFQCWVSVPLHDVSPVFDNDFLLSTNHSGSEVFNGPNTFPEIGWFKVDGDTAFSSAAQFSDPAILGLLIERSDDSVVFREGGAELPFTIGTQTNGKLLSTNLFGT
jgi:hypothetical protein